MPGTTMTALACPDCSANLRQDRTKMNVVVDACPHGHGLLLDRGDLEQIVGDETTELIRELAAKSRGDQSTCPMGHTGFREFTINHVRARGCTMCGALWFNNEDLKAHVAEVRKRAYGAGSMSARADVMRDATPFYAPEIVAGLLTDFQLEKGL